MGLDVLDITGWDDVNINVKFIKFSNSLLLNTALFLTSFTFSFFAFSLSPSSLYLGRPLSILQNQIKTNSKAQHDKYLPWLVQGVAQDALGALECRLPDGSNLVASFQHQAQLSPSHAPQLLYGFVNFVAL